MARGYRGIILVTAFVVVDCILIWLVNTNRVLPGVGVISSADQVLITLILVGAAIVAIFAAVLWKLKPWK
jgi:hypothetical protein